MCFSKLLVKVLKKRFHKLSLAEQEQVRSLVTETKSDTKEKLKKHRKRRTKIMAEETEVKKDEEVTSKKPEETVEETKTDEKVIEETEPKAEPKDAEQVEVQETEPTGNGVRVEDLVTKDDLAERLAAFEAKLDAVIKENADLKEQNAKLQENLSNANTQVADMKDKYETNDFGNSQRKGVQSQDKSANDTFAEYSKRFM